MWSIQDLRHPDQTMYGLAATGTGAAEDIHGAKEDGIVEEPVVTGMKETGDKHQEATGGTAVTGSR